MLPFKLALIQLGCPTPDKAANLKRALACIEEAAAQQSHMVVLPEYALLRIFDQASAQADAEDFGCSPDTDFSTFDVAASPSATLKALSQAARSHAIWLFAGSYPERSQGKIYNTMPVFNPQGKLIATYRKTHLCDMAFNDNIRESDFIAPGNQPVLVQTEYAAVACCICYDLRFPALAQIAAKQGAQLVLYPAFFPTRTGKLHWELLQRSRALDNSLFVATCGRAGDASIPWNPWGHSMVTDPQGQVVAAAGLEEAIVYADIDPSQAQEARQGLGLEGGLRPDLYQQYL